ncbi:enoyl-CoA hydratase/isomerase [Terricaulis sp.]|uniref:enoyl-CoA hydratase/isomerase n=1 Tax=Terricaulis sp. TaxID=2768686 RepID=UPI002AC39FD8|nr:enoyl-CoA hydratase/isomerase [Terricaulis sp.]MDZ4692381.1 enoyl-CoA hydratase/isomerase [Terricaulis sp.]
MAKAKYELEGGVALITLTDPATLNAISVEMTHELTAYFQRATSEARCVVLTGEGRGFSSGANLASGAPPVDADGQPDLGGRLEATFNPFVTMLRDLPIPYVTAVNGVAAGIGCSFALLGDLIVAGESAYFLQAFRRIGLVPDGSATYHLPRMIGRARAMEMMLLGDKIPAKTALEWGLINRCVPDADLLTTAKALATELANGPKSLGMIRRLGWASLDNTWEEQLQAERQMQREAGRSEDFREGVQAFFQKRPAKFSGA